MKCQKCQHENPETTKFCGECGTQLGPLSEAQPLFTETLETSQEELATGSVFAGRYQVIEELGKGGMGKVYKVLDNEINAKIALKLIKPEIAADQRTIERFRNELKTARDISHKNVCRMYDIGKERNAYFITMEYIEGQDLKGLVRQSGQLTVGTSISIATQICEGLAEAHRKGIVHRDLKPSNIMIDKQGNARIMDFGIARAIKGKGITGAGVMIGTPEYMSPEQVEGKDVDARSDLYSVGIILYEMLTGRVPFEGDTPFTVGVKQKSETPADPKDFNQDIPDDLSGLILKCLEKGKENRFQSVGELISELKKIKGGLPTSERPATKKTSITSKEITVSFNVRKVAIPVFLVIAAILAALFISKPWAKKPAASFLSDKASLAIMYFKNSTGDESLDHWRTALSDSIITDLSQSRYFEVLSSDRLFSILRKLNLLEASNYATEDLKEIASEGGVNHILVGSLFKSGDTYRIDYIIQDMATGKNRGTSRVEGEGEENILPMVDEITKKIKQDFNFSSEQIDGDIDLDIGTITTRSDEALKYYSQGRQVYNIGEYKKSIAFMERAVAEDPEFAMAYRSMSVAYFNLGLEAKRYETLRKAFELRHRLPDRERYTIAGDFFYGSESTWDKALENYNKVRDLYPDDLISNQNSALIYRDLEQWDMAIERTEVSRRHKALQAYGVTASAYSEKGQYDKARDVYLDYIENIQDTAIIRRGLANIYTCQRKFDLALAEVGKAISLNPESVSNANVRRAILVFTGELEEARLESLRLVESENTTDKVSGLRGLFLIAALQGKFVDAVTLAEQAIAISQSEEQRAREIEFRERLMDIFLYLRKWDEALIQINEVWPIAVERGSLSQQSRALSARGINFLKTGSAQDALKTAAELKEIIKSGLNEKAMRYYDYLIGLIEHQRKNYAGAVEYLQKARSQLPAEWNSTDAQAKFYFALGQALHKAGNLPEARKTFEEITLMTFGRNYCQHIYVLAFYELGRVFEDQRNGVQAIENYEKFLELWKDADPGLPEVEDARRRLAGLKGN